MSKQAALQIRANLQSIAANLWLLTTHIYHVMIISDLFQEIFHYYYFYFVEILLNYLELVFLELLNIWKSFIFCAGE